VTRTAVARERFGKHFSAETNSRSNKGAPFCAIHAEGLKYDKEDRLNQLKFGTPAWQYMSLGTEELN
jgi:hypothetical protein